MTDPDLLRAAMDALDDAANVTARAAALIEFSDASNEIFRGAEPWIALAAQIRARLESGGDDGWLPIESAPRDGTRIVAFGPLVVMDDGKRVASAPVAHVMLFKVYSQYAPAGDWWSPSLPTREDFWQLAHHPTHWRPLPAPPDAGE